MSPVVGGGGGDRLRAKTYRCPLQVRRPGGELSEEDVEAWETENELRFPDDYRRFLLAHNGGLLRPNTVQAGNGPSAAASD